MTVWILVALIYNGHLSNEVVPTLEFSTQEKCLTAIKAFEADSIDKKGTARMRCVRIEK